MLSSCAFGQYADTIIFWENSQMKYEPFNYEYYHGQTRLKKKESLSHIKSYEIHKRTFKNGNTQDSTTLSFQAEWYSEEVAYNLPNDFISGIDSVFIEQLEPVSKPYLHKIIHLYDRNGTAKITQYYPNGNLDYEYNFIADTTRFRVFPRYENGQYYNEEGLEQKQIGSDTAYWKKGVLHGVEIHKYENGNLEYKGYNYYNKKDNTFSHYYENGQTKEIGFYKKGHHSGKFTTWYPNGNLKSYSFFGERKKTGTWETWYPNGNPKSISFYNEKGLKSSIWKEWNEQGQLVKELNYKNVLYLFSNDYNNDAFDPKPFKVQTKKWYDNGQLKEISYQRINEDSYYKDYEEYYDNGQLKKKGHYANPFATASYAIFWCNCPRDYEMFLIGRNPSYKHKKWEYYNKNGDLLLTQKYRFGDLRKEKPYADELTIYDHFYANEEEYCRSRLVMNVEISDSTYEEKIYCINRRILGWTDTIYQKTVDDLGNSTEYIFEIVDFKDRYGTVHYQRFYPNGQKMADYNYEKSRDFDESLRKEKSRGGENVLVGKSTFWYPNGQIKWERIYEKYRSYASHYTKEICYYKNGRKKSISYPYVDEMTTWKT